MTLFIIGGAARTGKGILAQRLLHSNRVPYLSLDVLKMGLRRGLPSYSFDSDAGAIGVAEYLWPIVREMSYNLVGEGVPYLLEGEILPSQAAWLRLTFPGQVDGLFLGYKSMTPEQKVAEVRGHPASRNPWPEELTDEALIKIFAREIAYSQYLESACREHRLAYIDMSDGFQIALDRAYDLLARMISSSINGSGFTSQGLSP